MTGILNYILSLTTKFVYNYSTNSTAENNIVQSTSNSNNQRDENKIKTNKKTSVFDDNIALQPIKSQYKGHRNAR